MAEKKIYRPEIEALLAEFQETDAEFERVQASIAETEAETEKYLIKSQRLIDESKRVAKELHNARATLDDLDAEFERRTGLTALDKSILFFATGLQVLRWYFVSYFKERLDDQAAAKDVYGKGHNSEEVDRIHRYYNPSYLEITKNPVPFDALRGSNGALKGGGGLGHRATALGHDPIAGLIVGTANIATSTLTTSMSNAFQSYHITKDNKRDVFGNHADTLKVFQYTGHKLLHEGWDGKVIVGTSLGMEIKHLQSDVYSKKSLPLPLISTISPKLAGDLASYGFDMANVLTVTKQATLAIMVNSLIAMLHRAFYDKANDGDSKLYEVRTRKILTYSNMLSSAGNVVYVLSGLCSGDLTKIRKIDIGGFMVTLYRMFTDVEFIGQLKREFIRNSFDEKIRGDIDYTEFGIEPVR